MAKTKANLEKPQTPVPVKVNDPADDVEMEESDSQVTVFVVKNKALTKSGLGQSFTVLVPQGYGLNLLRRFVYSGCKPIAEREELKLMPECQQRVFPYDYPGCRAG